MKNYGRFNCYNYVIVEGKVYGVYKSATWVEDKVSNAWESTVSFFDKKDKIEKKTKGANGKYVDAPYHGKNDTSVKNKAAKEG